MSSPFSNKVFTNADQEIVQYNGELVDWRISAYVLVLKKESILIIKNKHEKLYDIPGGGIEPGELIQEAIDREAEEEAGAKVQIGKLIHVQEGFFKHANGNFYQTIQLFYMGKLKGKLGQPSEETTEFVGFVPLHELSEYPVPKAVQHSITLALKGKI